MKRIITAIILIFASVSILGAQAPEWVTRHPVSEKYYIGIGSAPVSDANRSRIATENALSDIASQIAVKIENESFMHIIDIDGKSREMFEEKVRSSMATWIEGQQLKDSYTSESTYYVYYVLDKKTYAENAEKKRSEAVRTGYSYLEKGSEAEGMSNISQAAVLYAKGLEAITPWLFMDMTYSYAGMEINVATELYSAYINLLGGMAITTNTVQVEGEPFKAVPDPIAGCLSKNGNAIPNIKLKAEFVTGNGTVTPPVETDYNGTAEFYITNITSKDDIQEIRISIDDSFFEALPEAYRSLVEKSTLPSARISIILKSAPATLYLHIGDNDLEGCENHIRNLLGNNSFALTDDPDTAQCFAELTTSLEMGNTVSGGNYDLNTCYCTLILKIFDNNNGTTLLDYSANNVKVLVPVHKSAEGTIAMAVREVMKRVNRELPKMLGKIKL